MKKSPDPFAVGLVIFVFILFSVTQFEFFTLLNKERPQSVSHSSATPSTAQATTSTGRTNSTPPSKPKESFFVEGTSIIHELPNGTRDIAILDFTKKMDVGIDGGIDIVAHPQENMAILSMRCWEGNGLRKLYRLDAVQKTVTLMKSQAPCNIDVEPEEGGQFQEYLIYPEEKRFIKVDLVNDTTSSVGILPEPYTYVSALDESGYSAFIPGGIEWVGGSFKADVFDGGVPLHLFDHRIPIMKKVIGPDG